LYENSDSAHERQGDHDQTDDEQIDYVLHGCHLHEFFQSGIYAIENATAMPAKTIIGAARRSFGMAEEREVTRFFMLALAEWRSERLRCCGCKLALATPFASGATTVTRGRWPGSW
jgi:hypothetical protein